MGRAKSVLSGRKNQENIGATQGFFFKSLAKIVMDAL